MADGDQDDNLTREASRSVLIVGPDESIYVLPNDVSVDALNSGFVSPFNKTFTVKELVRHRKHHQQFIPLFVNVD